MQSENSLGPIRLLGWTGLKSSSTIFEPHLVGHLRRIAKQVCDSSSPSVDFGGFAEIIATAVGGCLCYFGHDALCSAPDTRHGTQLQGEIDSWLARSIGYELAAEGLALVQEIGDRHGEAYAQYVMGLSDLQHERLSLARFHLSNSLILYQEFDDKLGQAHVLSAFGQVDDKDYLRSG